MTCIDGPRPAAEIHHALDDVAVIDQHDPIESRHVDHRKSIGFPPGHRFRSPQKKTGGPKAGPPVQQREVTSRGLPARPGSACHNRPFRPSASRWPASASARRAGRTNRLRPFFIELRAAFLLGAGTGDAFITRSISRARLSMARSTLTSPATASPMFCHHNWASLDNPARWFRSASTRRGPGCGRIRPGHPAWARGR